jgi:hypothetical protein
MLYARRYANGNLCSLVDVGHDRLYNARLSLYAPYSCQYRLYDFQTVVAVANMVDV